MTSKPNALASYKIQGSSNRLDVIFDPTQFAGNIWFVNSNTGTDSTSYGRTPDAPFASLNFAGNINSNTGLNNGVTGTPNGDVIYLMPGHTETISAAATSTLQTYASSGVSIIGMGVGRARPIFTFGTATAAQMVFSGANTLIRNCVFTLSLDAIAAGISVTGADFWMDNCEWDCNNATMGFVKCILTAATATRFKVTNSTFRGPAINSGTTTTACIDHEVGVNFWISGCDFHGKMTQAINNATTVLGGIIQGNCFEIYTGTKGINLAAATTCLITQNWFNVPSGSAPVVAAAGFVCGNFYSAAAGVTAGSALTW